MVKLSELLLTVSQKAGNVPNELTALYEETGNKNVTSMSYLLLSKSDKLLEGNKLRRNWLICKHDWKIELLSSSNTATLASFVWGGGGGRHQVC
jgi:hypothetical protein